MLIYADNAATTKMSQKAADTYLKYACEIFGNPSSLHSVGQKSAEALSLARDKIASCLNCTANEITFTSGGSESDNQALVTGAALGAKSGKRHIVSSSIEHHAVLHTLDALKKKGFEITLVGVDENGFVRLNEIESAIRSDTCLVSVMYANNEIGTVQPVSEIGRICRAKGVLFHSDAVQAAGHLPVNVKEQCIDMLSLSGHKFNGPKGIGALYARRGIVLENIIFGGAQERGKRAGTENIPAIMGMASALEDSYRNLTETNNKVIKLRDRLIDGISKIPHSVLNGDRVCRLPGNVSFCFEGIEGESLLLMLDDKGICASSGSACTSGSLDPSHVLLSLGRPHEIAHGSLRLSISLDNTDDEIDYIIKSVNEAVEYLRGISPVWRDLQQGKREFII